MKYLANIVIAISIGFLGYCSYYLYKELTSHVDKKGGEVIGNIVFKKKNASRRYTDSVIWEDIAQESEIYNYDAIRTMEQSSAVLTLKDGTKIELDQNTMLVVIMTDKALNINFDKGGVTAQNTSGSQSSIVLNSKDASIALNKGDISVNSDDGGMDIHLNSGNAKVSAGGKELSITPDVAATLKNGVAESSNEELIPEYPKHNSHMVSFDKSMPVSFSWKSGATGEAKVEIALNNRFNPVQKSYTSRKPSLTAELPAGDYYWRVVKGKSVSRSVKFSILSDKKPELMTPYSNQKIVLTEGAENVTFRWDKSKYAVNYEITVARDKEMSDIALNLTSRINIISASQLEQGNYFWRVKSIYPEGMLADSTTSGPGLFSLEKRQFALARVIPIDQGSVTTGGAFNLKWKGMDGAKGYRVEIASDPEFSSIIMAKNAVATYVRIDEKLSPGKYYWRVNAARGGKNSEWSETVLLPVTEPVEINLLYPVAGAVLFEKPETINFSWSDPNSGGNYTVELSERNDFRYIKESQQTSSSNIKIESPGLGVYFWRVILKDKTGKTIAQSRPGDFTIPADMKAPVLISPKEHEKIIPGIRKGLRLQWEKIDGVSEYEVELFQRMAGTERSLSVYTAKKPFIDLANELLYKPGEFSWKVKAKKMKGGKVTAYRESQKSFFEIEAVNLLPAPVIKSPEILFNSK